MLDVSVIRGDMTRHPDWGPAVRHADDLVRAELGEFQAGKVVEWQQLPDDLQAVDLTIRAGEHAGTARLSFDELSRASTVQSRARIAWGRLNLAQELWAIKRIQHVLTELMADAEASEAANG